MRFLYCILAVWLAFTAAFAEWSNQASTPSLIAGFAGEQVLPKIGVTSDGGSYVCRFDNSTGGYQVFLQRLSREGNLLWTPAEGVCVSSHPQMTWLTEYDMDVDQNGNAVIVFQDIRNAGVNNVMIYAVSPSGVIQWDPNGIALSTDTNTDYSNMSPVVFCSADNSSYAGWQRMGTSTEIRLQRVSETGQKLWGADGLTISSTSESCTWPQIIQADGNNVLVKYYMDSGPFWAPTRHVYIAKYSPDGQQLWNTVISNAGGIAAWQQLISFVPDGAGGAAIAWYDDRDGNQIADVYVQHVTSEGAVTMPANGALIATDASNQHYYPKLAIDGTNQYVFAFYKLTNGGQTQYGMGRQLLDFAGNRQWTDTGELMVNIGDYVASPVAACLTEEGALCLFSIGNVPQSDTSLYLRSACYRSSGLSPWDTEFKDVATTGTSKYHYDFAQHPEGWAVLAWEDDMTAMDIYAMRVNPDGSLGMQYPAPHDVTAEFIPPGSVLIGWQQPSPYLVPESYYVYINGELGQTVPGSQTSYQFDDLQPAFYSFYVKAYYGDGHYSEPSETVYATVVENSDPVAPPLAFSLSAWPNPFASKLTVAAKNGSGPELECRLFNLKGQLVSRVRIPANGETELDLSALPSGVYLLKVRQGENTIAKKVVKSR
jgi:hypothetical protein